MAMDALKNLTKNIPDWLTKLDELSSQVDQRQAELAAISASLPKGTPETRSLRNKGSQESLKPQDDGPSNIPPPDESDTDAAPALLPKCTESEANPVPMSPGVGLTSTAQRPARDVMATANARVKQQVRRRVRSSSVMSNENATQAYRTRSMIIVYYDSYVQSFFDDLVRFISLGRNLMRKARMAAKVAQIKRMAEVEVAKGDSPGDSTDSLPSLRYAHTRRTGPLGGLGRSGFGPSGASDKHNVYDDLDKGLELVQSICEHGAHQFLRDADCNEEVRKIQDKMRSVLAMAQKEMERVELEEPELAKETDEASKPRACRSISIRKELSSSHKNNQAITSTVCGETSDVISVRSEKEYHEPRPMALEVDTFGAGEHDEGDLDFEAQLPKLQYRSTRAMRAQPYQYVSRGGS